MTTEYDKLADLYEYQYGQTTFDLDFYVSEAQSAEPRVLELACGTGRVTLPIARAGVPIVGVDSSGNMLDGARQKAAAEGDLSLPVLCWPKNAIRAGISRSVPIAPLGDPSKSGAITVFHPFETRSTRVGAVQGSVREQLVRLSGARLEKANLHQVASTHLIH